MHANRPTVKTRSRPRPTASTQSIGPRPGVVVPTTGPPSQAKSAPALRPRPGSDRRAAVALTSTLPPNVCSHNRPVDDHDVDDQHGRNAQTRPPGSQARTTALDLALAPTGPSPRRPSRLARGQRRAGAWPRSGSSARSPGRRSRRRQLDDPETSWLIVVLNPQLSLKQLVGRGQLCVLASDELRVG